MEAGRYKYREREALKHHYVSHPCPSRSRLMSGNFLAMWFPSSFLLPWVRYFAQRVYVTDIVSEENLPACKSALSTSRHDACFPRPLRRPGIYIQRTTPGLHLLKSMAGFGSIPDRHTRYVASKLGHETPLMLCRGYMGC